MADGHQSGDSQQEPQQQAGHEEADTAHQHGNHPTEQADAQANARAGFHAELRVQQPLSVTQQEDDHRAEHQAGQEHNGLEAAVTWEGKRTKWAGELRQVGKKTEIPLLKDQKLQYSAHPLGGSRDYFFNIHSIHKLVNYLPQSQSLK